jgi:RNA polymerase sigma factor (sigma-70 family)
MSVVRLSKRLWREYVHQNRIKASKKAAENRLRRRREALIVEHMPRAAEIARQVWHRFNRGCHVSVEGHASGGNAYGDRIDLEDMISCAYLGLVEAAGRWDPAKGDFAKYSYLRVRGAIVDAHRRQAYMEALHDSIDEWFRDDVGNHRGSGGEGFRKLEGQYLTDPQPLPDELANQGKLAHVAVAFIDRELPDDERVVIRQALAGATVASIGQGLGRSPAWARAKLEAARDKVAAAVQRKAA